MSQGGTIISFDNVTFLYGPKKPILDEVSFPIRRGAKITLMGQNGAGKSTLFQLLTGALKPEEGVINIAARTTIAVSLQVVPRNQLDFSVRDFFQAVFKEKQYDIDKQIKNVLEIVGLPFPDLEKKMRDFSGGQQARLLLASALIQNPDVLLLDEPTNNLDKAGIEHLTDFIKQYPKTVIVISHDAEFLNSFTEGVLYLDVFTRKVEQYVGNYFDVVEQIKARVEKERSLNARLEKSIQEKKDKANFFANKGGRLRALAKTMREDAAEAEENKVDVRREDKAIRPFVIPAQEDLTGELYSISSFTRMIDGKQQEKKVSISLKKGSRLLLKGPNGIGKTTLLESMARGTAAGATIKPGVTIGYYRQDFSTLNFEDTVFKSLTEILDHVDEQKVRSVAAGFLITGDMIHTKIGALSEGQKGLVAFARLVLQKPGLLILDEPTNHINFRHLPVIAQALDKYEGAMIIISHVPEFIEQIHITDTLDLAKN